MTAWEALKAASSLAFGTAWELLTSPKTGSGTVLNDGYAVSLPTGYSAIFFPTAVTVALAPAPAVAIAAPGLTSAASSTPIVVQLGPTLTVEVPT